MDQSRTIVLWAAAILLPAAFYFSMVSDLPHITVITILLLAFSAIRSRGWRISDRSVIYFTVLAMAITLFGNYLAPLKQDRFGFMLLGGTLMVRYLDGGSRRSLFGCGLAAGLAFGFRQPCGFVLVIAAVFTLALEAWSRRLAWRCFFRNLGIWSGGVLCVPLFLAVYLTVCGAWPDYLRQNFIYVSEFGMERGGSGSVRQMLVTFFPPEGFLVFPLFSLGLFFWCCRSLYSRREVERYLPLAAAVLVGLASWHQFFPVPCVRHLYWASVPMFGVLAYAAEQVWQNSWGKEARILVLSLILILPGLEIGYRVFAAAMRLSYISTRRCSDIPGLRGVLMFPQEFHYFRSLQAGFERVPQPLRDRYYLNMTDNALFCRFFPDRPAAHPMYVDWGDRVYPDYHDGGRSHRRAEPAEHPGFGGGARRCSDRGGRHLPLLPPDAGAAHRSEPVQGDRRAFHDRRRAGQAQGHRPG